MANVRQSDVSGAMVNLLKKMDTMLETSKASVDQSYIVLSSVEAVMKNEISAELKKQTSILMSIESKLGAASRDEASAGRPKDYKEVLGNIATGIEKIIKATEKISEKSGDKLKKFFNNLTESLSSLTNDIDENKAKGIAIVLTSIGSSILKFGLSLALYTLISPLAMIGATMFGLTIRLLMLTAGAVDEKSSKGIAAVLGLASGVLKFGAALVLYTIISPIAMVGAVLFGLTIRLLLLAAGTASIGQAKAMRAVLSLARGVLLFALAMVAVTLLAPVVLIGALIISASLFVLSFSLYLMGSRQVRRGVVSLLFATLGIALLGLTILTFATLVKPMDALFTVLTLSVVGLVFVVAGKYFKEIFLGSLAMAAASISIAVLGMSLLLFKSSKMEFKDAAILGAVIVGLGLSMYTAGKYVTEILSGSIALGAASVALILTSTALLIFKKANFTFMDAAILGAVIVGMGVAFGIAGTGPLPFFIGAGGIAIGIASLALIPLSIGLTLFKKANLTLNDAAVLGSVVGAIALSFSALGLSSPFILLGAGAMLAAGLALIPITSSLATFKNTGFTTADADNLEYMIGSIVRAFGIVTDTDRQKKLGFYVNPLQLFFGIMALSGAGRVLAGLADGIKAWANLEVNEWEVINPGTEKAKLVIKSRRKLDKTDFDNAAIGMATVISAIAKPFADVGKLQMGMASNVPMLDSVFGGDYVSKGISALKGAGDTIVGLAEGVKAFSNLEFTEYEVIGAGTSKAKLVPKSRKKLSETDITNAGYNISKILKVAAEGFYNVGKGDDSWWGSGYVSAGVSALKGVGDIILGLAEGVKSFSNLEFTEYEVIGAGTSKAKLVPKAVKKLTEADLTSAGYNISKILKIVAEGFYNIGKGDDSWWGSGYVTKGVSSLSGVGDTVSKIADTVFKIATGEIPQLKEVNGKLVQGPSIKITDTMLKIAAGTIKEIIMIIGGGIYDFGVYYSNNKSQIDSALGIMPNMSEILKNLAYTTETWGNIKKPDKGSKNIKTFIETLSYVFDPKFNPNIGKNMAYMTIFTNNIRTLTSPINELKKVADNFERIQKSMKLTKDHINSFDLKKLTLTDSLMKSIAAMSKNPEAIAAMVGTTMEKAFEELINALKELSQTQVSQTQQMMGQLPTNQMMGATAMPISANVTAVNPPVRPQITPDELKKALSDALAIYFGSGSGGIKVIPMTPFGQ